MEITLGPFWSGYLPFFVGINIEWAGSSSTIGTRDITTLTDQDGNAPGDITDAQKGAVTLTIAASAADAYGSSVTGTLKLKASEVRGRRFATTVAYNSAPTKSTLTTLVNGGTTALFPMSTASSCWTGSGSYTSSTSAISGTATQPQAGEGATTAFAVFVAALEAADTWGNAPRFSSLTGYNTNTALLTNSPCGFPTMDSQTAMVSTTRYDYLSAAHVLELTPVELIFSKPVSGAWNSTLTMTAYQM